jgi:hypothetical protein
MGAACAELEYVSRQVREARILGGGRCATAAVCVNHPFSLSYYGCAVSWCCKPHDSGPVAWIGREPICRIPNDCASVPQGNQGHPGGLTPKSWPIFGVVSSWQWAVFEWRNPRYRIELVTRVPRSERRRKHRLRDEPREANEASGWKPIQWPDT